MTGCIDIYGYADSVGGWLICGWVPAIAASSISGERELVLRFDRGSLKIDGLVTETVRGDLGDRGCGVMIHAAVGEHTLGALRSVEIAGPDWDLLMRATADVACDSGVALIETLDAQRLAPTGEISDRMRAILARTGFNGADTLEQFDGRFAFKVDEAILCGSNDILLNGWLIAPASEVRAVRLRCGGRNTALDVRAAVRVSRPDVVAKYGDALHSRNAACGFVLHVLDCLEPNSVAYIEIELASSEVAHVRLPPSRLRGLAAIRNTLSNLFPRYDEVQRTFDVIGPALSRLNEERLQAPRSHREICFGMTPPAPICSLIVPVFGRIDYMEVQVALMAQAGDLAQRHELIYVIDDPDGADAASYLADTLFRRFGVPLRLLLLEENLGFAPACNAGLGVARGTHVCFLNSDAFALQPNWLDRLLENFDRHPSVGIVGPLLLFEDGTIQHQGMRYEALPEFSHWLFPVHPGKGSRAGESRTLALHPAITGACMLMSRQLALDLDGFDESYVIGDFEDSDLCLRARQFGVASAIDHGVALYHLERKSQAAASETWRLNVTLYNAWVHQRRWATRLAADAEGSRERSVATVAVAALLAGSLARDDPAEPLAQAEAPWPADRFGLSRALGPAGRPDSAPATAARRLAAAPLPAEPEPVPETALWRTILNLRRFRVLQR